MQKILVFLSAKRGHRLVRSTKGTSQTDPAPRVKASTDTVNPFNQLESPSDR